MGRYITIFILLFILPLTKTALADTAPLRVAVSSNFAPILEKLLPAFETKKQIEVQVISAATGTLYQQILHGAPFDVFLSADSTRPDNLVTQKLVHENISMNYAIGRLSFYSATAPNLTFSELVKKPDSIRKLSIANPAFAPYGLAAKQALQQAGSWKNMQKKLILGINVNQTFQQVRSHAATAGIVATSQLVLNGLIGESIPQHYYQPINQKAVILKSTKQLAQAQQFIDYIISPSVQQQLAQWGYQSVNSTRYEYD